jgi:hypothetical protein
MAVRDLEYYKSTEFKRRINKMFAWDCVFGWVFVLWLWLTYAFVFFMTVSQSDFASGGVRIALIVGGFLVCIYNTGSISAMVRHYSHDKDFIYTVDLRHLDAYRASKKNSEPQ